MLKFGTLLLAMGLGGLGALGYSAPHRVREQVDAMLQDRCRRAASATCAVDRVEMALDGVLLRGIHVRSSHGRLSATVDRVAVRLNWLPLFLHQPQELTVQADGVSVHARGALTDLVTELVPERSQSLAVAGHTLRVNRAAVEHLTLDLQPDEGAPLPLAARIASATLHWDREHESTLRWLSGSARIGAGPSVETGTCSVLRADTGPTSVDCSGFSGSVDLATLAATQAAVSQEIASLRTLLASRARAAAPTPLPDAIEARAPEEFQLRGHDGRVRLLYHQDTLANLDPVVASLTLDEGRVHEARLQVGGDRAGNPSLSLVYARRADGWSVDLDGDGLPLRQLAPWVPVVPWHGTDVGIARAHVHVRPMDIADVIRVDGSVTVENFGLSHRGLAHDPIDSLAVDVDGSAIFDLPRRRVETPGVTVHVNGIPFTLAGWFQQHAHRVAMDASLRVPEVACDDIRRSLPRVVTGPLAGFDFAGSLGGDAHVVLDTAHLGDTQLAFDVRNECSVVHQGPDVNLRRFGLPFVQRVEEPGGVLRAFVTGPGAPAWVSLDAIAPYVPSAVVNREDGGFYRHHGFSPDEIRGALVRDLSAGRFAYGASTLSMQLVKNVFLEREKTLVRKLQEVALTWWVEQSLDKSAILELYLNVVEFGPGIYGVGPAARFFFARQPQDLTPLQSIYLATLLPAPIPRYVNFERGAVSPEGLSRLRAIARSMGANHLLTPEEVTAAQQEVLAFRPAHAPIPGPVTLNVDPSTTDDQAAGIAASQPPAGIYATTGTDPSDAAPVATEGADTTPPATDVQGGDEADDDGAAPAQAPAPTGTPRRRRR